MNVLSIHSESFVNAFDDLSFCQFVARQDNPSVTDRCLFGRHLVEYFMKPALFSIRRPTMIYAFVRRRVDQLRNFFKRFFGNTLVVLFESVEKTAFKRMNAASSRPISRAPLIVLPVPLRGG